MLATILEDSIGSVCELRTMKNDLIFVGRLQSFDGTAVTVTEFSEGRIPPIFNNTEVKLVIYVRGGRLSVWTGRVWGNGATFWKVGDLADFKFVEHRASFRQRVKCAGTALCVNSIYRPRAAKRAKFFPASACILEDVSLGGALIRCKQPYLLNDCLMLFGLKLLPKERPFSFLCQVRRVDDSDPRDPRYGLRFEESPEAERNRLCQVIFALQRLDLQKHKQQN